MNKQLLVGVGKREKEFRNIRSYLFKSSYG
jgi:hypothetical protein